MGRIPPPPQHSFRIVAFGVLCSVLLAAVLLSVPVVGSDRQGSDSAAPVTLPELAAWFRAQQQLVLPIAPPTGSPFRQQGYPKALPFEPADFPLEMRQKLPGLVSYDCPVYPIVLVEDPDTRATVILNMHGEPVHSLPPLPDYDPSAYAQAKFPGLGAGAESAALLALYDPARIQIAVNLVPTAFHADYLAAVDRLADDLEGGIIASSPYTSNDLWLEINGATNGCTGWTADLTIHTPDGDTNTSYDVYYAPALDAPTDWQFLMRCPTNIIAQTNVFARYLCEAQGFFSLMETTNNCDLIVSTNITPQAMAELLMPPWVTVTNADYTGAVVARGTFSNGNCCGLPVDSGVILSSGYISNAPGPNDDNGGSTLGNVFGGPDADLNRLLDGRGSDDAAVLEFDVIATNACILQFSYVYASEEYPEFSGEHYNDPFAVFVTTNRVGTNWIHAITNNIALLPCGTNVPVTVNTVCGGCTSDYFDSEYVPPANPQYYVDNHDPFYQSAPPFSAGEPVVKIQCDGMTVLLRAETSISAGVTNHIKIAIADYSDFVYDSVVFLEASAPGPCP